MKLIAVISAVIVLNIMAQALFRHYVPRPGRDDFELAEFVRAQINVVRIRSLLVLINTWWLTQWFDGAQSWFAKFLWNMREASFIDSKAYIIAGTLSVSLLGVAAALGRSRNIFIQTLATSAEYVLKGFVGLALTVVAVQHIWLIWSASQTSSGILAPIQNAVGWPYLILWIPLVGYACFAAILMLIRPVTVAIKLIVLPIFRRKPRIVDADSISLEYHAKRLKVFEERSSPVRLLLLSDLHITGDGGPALQGNDPSSNTTPFIERVLAERSCDVVVVAGDITDVGDPKAWGKAASLFNPYQDHLFAVPGNHDVHFVRMVHPGMFGRMSENSDETAKNLSSFLGRSISYPCLSRYGDLGIVLLGLDSNTRPPSTPFTNAVGSVGKEQMLIARSLLQSAAKPGDVVIVVMHHHLLAPKFSFENSYLTCEDSVEILDFLFENKVSIVVHGHKHMPYVARLCRQDHELTIVSVGSTHYSAEGPCKKEAREPSVYEVKIYDGTVKSVEFIKQSSVCASTVTPAAAG